VLGTLLLLLLVVGRSLWLATLTLLLTLCLALPQRQLQLPDSPHGLGSLMLLLLRPMQLHQQPPALCLGCSSFWLVATVPGQLPQVPCWWWCSWMSRFL
jgi:hypothetical protein